MNASMMKTVMKLYRLMKLKEHTDRQIDEVLARKIVSTDTGFSTC